MTQPMPMPSNGLPTHSGMPSSSTTRQRTTCRHARMYPAYRQQLGATAYFVLATLREFIFDHETRTVDYGWLASETNLSHSTICRAVEQIVAAGFITRERTHSGRGHSYRITMLPPPELQAAAPAPKTHHKRTTNDAPVNRFVPPVDPVPISQTGDFAPPISESENQNQQQQPSVGEVVVIPSSTPAAPTAQLAPDPLELLAPAQRELYAALCQAGTNPALALRLVQQNPTLTPHDFAHDLAVAAARATTQRPLGLVLATWRQQRRITAPHAPHDPPPCPTPPAALTPTEAVLRQAGFSAKAAHEFRHLDHAAVQATVKHELATADTQGKRDQVIGRLVVAWRTGTTPGAAPAAPVSDTPIVLAAGLDPSERERWLARFRAAPPAERAQVLAAFHARAGATP